MQKRKNEQLVPEIVAVREVLAVLDDTLQRTLVRLHETMVLLEVGHVNRDGHSLSLTLAQTIDVEGASPLILELIKLELTQVSEQGFCSILGPILLQGHIKLHVR